MARTAPSYGFSLLAIPPEGPEKAPVLERASLGDSVEVFGGAKSRDEAIMKDRQSSKRNKRIFPFELRSKQAPGQPGVLVDLLTAGSQSRLLHGLVDREQPFEDLKNNFLELDAPLKCLEAFAEGLYSKVVFVSGPKEAVDLLALGSYLMAPSLQEAMIGYLERCWCSGPDALMDVDLALSLWAQVRRGRRAVPDEEAKMQKALQRLDRQALSFVHKYFQGVSEVPPGLTLSDIDALLGSADLACDDEGRVLQFLQEWHEQRGEPLNIGLVLKYVKLEYLDGPTLLKVYNRVPEPHRDKLQATLSAWSNTRGAVPRTLAGCNDTLDPANVLSNLQPGLLPPRRRSPVFPFDVTFMVQNLAELYAEGQARKNNVLFAYDFDSPVSALSRASPSLRFLLFPYGHGEPDWKSAYGKLCVGYNFHGVAESVSLVVQASLDGAAFEGSNDAFQAAKPNCSIMYMPLKDGKPEELRESGTLVFQMTVKGIKPRLAKPRKRPQPEEDLVRDLLGPLAAHSFPGAEDAEDAEVYIGPGDLGDAPDESDDSNEDGPARPAG